RKEERGRLSRKSQSKLQRPDSGDDDWCAAPVSNLPKKCARVEIKRVDRAITKVSNEQSVVKIAEAFECRPSHPPWRVKLTFAYESLEQMSLGIENVDETIAGTSDIVFFSTVALSVSHIDVTI